MKNFNLLLTIIFIFSCNTSEKNNPSEIKSTKIEDKFPREFLNKPLYESPYFICRDNIFIDDYLNFTYTIYSVGKLANSETRIVKGKLNLDGTITFLGSNRFKFPEFYMPSEILPKWDINNSCYGKVTCISLYSRVFNQRTRNYEEYNISFSTEKCNQSY
jgi:hypothetical protein